MADPENVGDALPTRLAAMQISGRLWMGLGADRLGEDKGAGPGGHHPQELVASSLEGAPEEWEKMRTQQEQSWRKVGDLQQCWC